MGKHVDYPRLRAIYELVRQSPGIRAGDIGKRAGIEYKTLRRALYNMDKYGLLLCEDDNGGLQVYEG